MQNAEWIKIKEVFNQTLNLPFGERESFLQNYDEFIQTEVRNLIKSDEQADEFIEQPAAVEFGITQDLNIGQIIDDYKIVSLIGEGGMGNVYLAERIGFEQKVALKLIKRGMDTRAVLKRFKLERQILSRLNHPNIAKLLGGGETKDGLPYFAMEYIEGETITKFCESHLFDVNERLELFQKVCDAVSYAHKNLIIHRDLKPSNIIVTDDGTPKLLDFGIAKLLDDENDKTQTIGRMFTPEYASPEQINGLPITTATDVYSLGVVLYELLSGVRPFNCKSKSYGEIANLILTVEPQKPSAVVSGQWSVVRNTSEIKDKTQSEQIRNPQSAIRNLKGDLDNIILKSLCKEPDSRYQTINDFSADILRHLQGLPVTATNATTSYRFQKFVQRNKKSVVMATFVGLLILSISGIAVWQAITANRERAKAERRLLETRKLANSLMFEIHDSLENLPGATASRELLLKNAVEYLDALYLESNDNPDLLFELSVAYRKIAEIKGDAFGSNTGNSSEALGYFLKAFEIQNKLVQIDAKNTKILEETAYTASGLGDFYQLHQNDHKKSFECYGISQKFYEELLAFDPKNDRVKAGLTTLYNKTGGILFNQGKFEDSKIQYTLGQKHIESALQNQPDNPEILRIAIGHFTLQGNFAGNPNYNDTGEQQKAIGLLEKSLSLAENLRKTAPDDKNSSSQIGLINRDLGDVHLANKNLSKATEYYQKALSIHQEIAEKDSNDMYSQAIFAASLGKIGNILVEQGKTTNALVVNQKAVSSLEKFYNKDRESLSLTYTYGLILENLSDAYFAGKDFSEALKNYEQSHFLIQKSLADSNSSELEIALARVKLKRGKTKTNLKTACVSTLDDFQQSYEQFKKVKDRLHLSPTNVELMSEAQQLLNSLKCS